MKKRTCWSLVLMGAVLAQSALPVSANEDNVDYYARLAKANARVVAQSREAIAPATGEFLDCWGTYDLKDYKDGDHIQLAGNDADGVYPSRYGTGFIVDLAKLKEAGYVAFDLAGFNRKAKGPRFEVGIGALKANGNLTRLSLHIHQVRADIKHLSRLQREAAFERAIEANKGVIDSALSSRFQAASNQVNFRPDSGQQVLVSFNPEQEGVKGLSLTCTAK